MIWYLGKKNEWDVDSAGKQMRSVVYATVTAGFKHERPAVAPPIRTSRPALLVHTKYTRQTR